MTRLRPHQVEPLTPSGTTPGDGTYGLAVVAGEVDGLVEVTAPVDLAVSVILLPPGSDATDVPAGTPVGTIIFVEA